MNKKTILKKLNSKIDELILKGKEHTKEYKRLIRLHYNIVNS